ncbi:gas vesicle protein GvpG [Chlorobium phaeovibrioides]|uniref:gas vesicle protein GvpG n=1 Tax=Chlorobium phaeovibrioides TaxID=1094 RepID=UPI0019212CB2|nr:gas vesicle protein GvpG [Chlorobium phaeovibrioides]MDT9546672.1 gas vesicle protein GvpG [Chlorobium phaeovibrioides]
MLAPLSGMVFLGRKINEIVQNEMSDEGAVKEQLMKLQFRFEMDELSEEEYDRLEDELLSTLADIRAQKENR